MEEEFVVKEGWVVKESGQAVLGQTNWRKRWCRLVRGSNGASWSYYRWLLLLFSCLFVMDTLSLFGSLLCKYPWIFNSVKRLYWEVTTHEQIVKYLSKNVPEARKHPCSCCYVFRAARENLKFISFYGRLETFWLVWSFRSEQCWSSDSIAIALGSIINKLIFTQWYSVTKHLVEWFNYTWRNDLKSLLFHSLSWNFFTQ